MTDPAVENVPPTEETTATEMDKKADLKEETATVDAADSVTSADKQSTSAPGGPIVSSSKKTRPTYKFDPDKITLRFLFANKDGLTVTVECNPTDTVAEVKASLMSVWPDNLPECKGGDQLRLVCMGKGYLEPDSRTLKDCEIPVFKTHPTPVNVSVRPEGRKEDEKSLKKKDNDAVSNNRIGGRSGQNAPGAGNTAQVDQGCGCIIL